MRIVDHLVASEVEKSIVEVGERFFEITKKKVGDSLLKVCDCQVLV